MARLLLLLKVRLLLSLRRYQGRGALLVVGTLTVCLMAVLGLAVGSSLAHQHQLMRQADARTLADVAFITVTLFLLLGPLIGFRGNEAMDPGRLFQYPLRPSLVFLSSALGHFLNAGLLLWVPILLLPGLAAAPGPLAASLFVAGLFLELLLVFAVVQCLVLVLLNVLRSRLFADLLALLTPLIVIGTYIALRPVLFGFDAPEGNADLVALVGKVDTAPLRLLLPPLWTAGLPYMDPLEQASVLLALVALLLAVMPLGVKLTLAAFHGEIAIATPERAIDERRGRLRRLLGAALPPAVGAVYGKELDTLRREPFLRSLFVQQCALVVVLLVMGRSLGPDGEGSGLMFAGFVLVFAEAGFLMNALGLEGPALRQSALLPIRGAVLLTGKNVAQLQFLGTTDLLFVPLLGLLAMWQGGGPYPVDEVLRLMAILLLATPILLGVGNLVSVLLPSPSPQRGKRVLGQERTGQEGCLWAVLRSVLTLGGFVPVAIVLAVGFSPALLGDRLPFLGYGLTLPLGLVLSLLLYAVATVLAGEQLDRRWPRLLQLV
ncbi:MAG: hypothetical protein R3F30_13145 [Planctomycetota bacterium]